MMRVTFKPFSRDMPTIFLLGRVKRAYRQLETEAIEALQATSGLTFLSGVVMKVGFTDSGMWEGSAGYVGRKAIALLFPKLPPAEFDELVLWLAMHELGHRLLEQNGVQHTYDGGDMEKWHEMEHRLLFLFLIDALMLLGERGERAVRTFPPMAYTDRRYGNTRAWRWAKNLSAKQRRELQGKIVATRNLSLLDE